MNWKVDPDQSRIGFLVRHLVVTTVRGSFGSFEGTLNMDEENPQASVVEGTVDVASIQTGISMRNNNLLSAGRFDANRFPKMSFRSTRIGPFEGDNFKVYGDLTIKDITQSVVFEVVNKKELPSAEGVRRWVFGATIEVNRKDFGIEWNAFFELGGLFVGDIISGELEIQVVQE